MHVEAINHVSFKRACFISIIILLLFGPPLGTPQSHCLYGQHPGLKYFKNYSPIDYGNQPQNWAVLQDKRGMIYVGNHGGLLEFDGVSWRLIRIPNYSVRSMAIDDRGNIFIGGNNEIGCLTPDLRGSLHYVSLLDRLKDEQKNFGDVWRTFATGEGVYFCTRKFLFRWDGKQMKVWESAYLFHMSFTCTGQFFINHMRLGLMHMVDDSLKLIPGGAAFVGKKIYMMAPFHMGRLLIGTGSEGFYLYDGESALPFHTGADQYLKENRLSYGTRLANGDFVLATWLGGIVIIDSAGKLKQILDKDSGLSDNNVWYVYEDFQGNLWLALNNGITRIAYASPISFYDNRTHLPGMVLSLTRFGQHHNLVVGTTSGLHILAVDGNFRPIPGLAQMCFDILAAGDSLLTATNYGVYQVRPGTNNGTNPNSLVCDSPAHVLLQSQKEPERVWVGTVYGLVSLHRQQGDWSLEHKFAEITGAISKIIEDRQGNLWCGTLTKGVLKVDFSAAGDMIAASPAPYPSKLRLKLGY